MIKNLCTFFGVEVDFDELERLFLYKDAYESIKVIIEWD